jgi:uncharacterized protein DUF5994
MPPPASASARLAPRPPTFPPGRGYGARLSRSEDLAAELPATAEVFDTRQGRVRQVAVGRSTWPTAPHDLLVTATPWGHLVRLLARPGHGQDLLVRPRPLGPAGCSARNGAHGGRLMAAAADPALRLTASALLAAEEHRPAEDDVPRRTSRQDAS